MRKQAKVKSCPPAPKKKSTRLQHKGASSQEEELPEAGVSQTQSKFTPDEENYLKQQELKERFLAEHPVPDQRTKKERQELKNIQNKITKLQKKIDVYDLLTKKATKSATQRKQEQRRRQTDDEKKHEQEAAMMRMRKLRGKQTIQESQTVKENEERVVDSTDDEMDTSTQDQVQVHAGPGEVDPHLAEGDDAAQEKQELEAEAYPRDPHPSTPM